LGLNYTLWGITLASIVISLYCLILVFIVIAWLRRRTLLPEERFSLKLDFLTARSREITPTDKVIVLVIAIALVIGGALLIFIATHPPREHSTELYLLDENGTLENYPTNLEVNESSSIIIVVVCHEEETTDYQTVVRLIPERGINQTPTQYSFSLTDDKEWRQVFNFSANESGTYKLEVELFKTDDIIPYATTHVWIDVRN
ncbi:MAG: DUF1616 domain-containing protein, partial [Methanomassiliicoccales archaeon]